MFSYVADSSLQCSASCELSQSYFKIWHDVYLLLEIWHVNCGEDRTGEVIVWDRILSVNMLRFVSAYLLAKVSLRASDWTTILRCVFNLFFNRNVQRWKHVFFFEVLRTDLFKKRRTLSKISISISLVDLVKEYYFLYDTRVWHICHSMFVT